MASNYHPWKVNIDDFFSKISNREKVLFLLRFAILAPSSHNSQPWKFDVTENSIGLFADRNRRLKDSDKNDRQLFISLGCAITNILVAVDYYGLKAAVTYMPDLNDDAYAARIDFSFEGKNVPSAKNHLIFSIPQRVNNRNRYTAVMPNETFLSEINKLQDESLTIMRISDRSHRERLAEVALAAGVFAMEDTYFRRELSHYVKSNMTRSHVGMPAFGMGIPTPVSFFAPRMIRFFNMNKISFKNDEKLLKEFTPMFCVIATRDDGAMAWIKAGEAYERISLFACRSGLSTAVWAAPIQIGQYYRDLQSILGTEFRPQMFFRVGYAQKMTPHSPRIPVERLLIHP
jgi:nitroreductase